MRHAIEAADVQSYIQKSPEERQVVLTRLRSLCQELLTGYEECIEYGMPAYKSAGAVQVAFASQKQYISLYVMKEDIVDEHRRSLVKCSVGKGCIRFKRPEHINFDVVRSLLTHTRESHSDPC